MDIIRTASGKTFESDYIAEVPDLNRLYLRVLNKEMLEIVQVFSNPDETIQLWYNDMYISGYNHLIGISDEGDAYKIRLQRA